MVVVTFDSLDTILGGPISRGRISVFYRVGYKPYLGDENTAYPVRTDIQIVAGALTTPLEAVPTGVVCYAAITITNDITGQSKQVNVTIPETDVDYDDLMLVDPVTFVPLSPEPATAQEVLAQAYLSLGAAVDAQASAAAAAGARDAAQAAVASVIPSTDSAMATVAADPESEFAQAQANTYGSVAMSNPESDLNSATVAVVNEVLGGGVAGMLRVVDARGNLSIARGSSAGVVAWLINVGDADPSNIVAGDLIWEVAEETAPTPTVLFSDDFNRANGSLGSTPVGAKAWTVAGGTFVGGIVSNRAKFTSGSGSGYIVADAGAADLTYEATQTVVGTSKTGGITFRYVDTSNHLLLLSRVSGSDFHYRLAKRVAGTVSTIATYSVLSADGDVCKIGLSGNTITITINGTLIATETVADFNTATQFGFYGIGTDVSWDDASAVVYP